MPPDNAVKQLVVAGDILFAALGVVPNPFRERCVHLPRFFGCKLRLFLIYHIFILVIAQIHAVFYGHIAVIEQIFKYMIRAHTFRAVGVYRGNAAVCGFVFELVFTRNGSPQRDKRNVSAEVLFEEVFIVLYVYPRRTEVSRYIARADCWGQGRGERRNVL